MLNWIMLDYEDPPQEFSIFTTDSGIVTTNIRLETH